jgi:hypothetical protein
MSPHIVYPFELFIFNKLDFGSGIGIEFIIIFQKFIADRVAHDVRIESVKINIGATFIYFMSLFTLDELYAFN